MTSEPADSARTDEAEKRPKVRQKGEVKKSRKKSPLENGNGGGTESKGASELQRAKDPEHRRRRTKGEGSGAKKEEKAHHKKSKNGAKVVGGADEVTKLEAGKEVDGATAEGEDVAESTIENLRNDNKTSKQRSKSNREGNVEKDAPPASRDAGDAATDTASSDSLLVELSKKKKDGKSKTGADYTVPKEEPGSTAGGSTATESEDEGGRVEKQRIAKKTAKLRSEKRRTHVSASGKKTTLDSKAYPKKHRFNRSSSTETSDSSTGESEASSESGDRGRRHTKKSNVALLKAKLRERDRRYRDRRRASKKGRTETTWRRRVGARAASSLEDMMEGEEEEEEEEEDASSDYSDNSDYVRCQDSHAQKSSRRQKHYSGAHRGGDQQRHLRKEQQVVVVDNTNTRTRKTKPKEAMTGGDDAKKKSHRFSKNKDERRDSTVEVVLITKNHHRSKGKEEPVVKSRRGERRTRPAAEGRTPREPSKSPETKRGGLPKMALIAKSGRRRRMSSLPEELSDGESPSVNPLLFARKSGKVYRRRSCREATSQSSASWPSSGFSEDSCSDSDLAEFENVQRKSRALASKRKTARRGHFVDLRSSASSTASASSLTFSSLSSSSSASDFGRHHRVSSSSTSSASSSSSASSETASSSEYLTEKEKKRLRARQRKSGRVAHRSEVKTPSSSRRSKELHPRPRRSKRVEKETKKVSKQATPLTQKKALAEKKPVKREKPSNVETTQSPATTSDAWLELETRSVADNCSVPRLVSSSLSTPTPTTTATATAAAMFANIQSRQVSLTDTVPRTINQGSQLPHSAVCPRLTDASSLSSAGSSRIAGKIGVASTGAVATPEAPAASSSVDSLSATQSTVGLSSGTASAAIAASGASSLATAAVSSGHPCRVFPPALASFFPESGAAFPSYPNAPTDLYRDTGATLTSSKPTLLDTASSTSRDVSATLNGLGGKTHRKGTLTESSSSKAPTSAVTEAKKLKPPMIRFQVTWKPPKGRTLQVKVTGTIAELSGSLDGTAECINCELDADDLGYENLWMSNYLAITSVKPNTKISYRYFVWDEDKGQMFREERLNRINNREEARHFTLLAPLSNKLGDRKYTIVDGDFGDLSCRRRYVLSRILHPNTDVDSDVTRDPYDI